MAHHADEPVAVTTSERTVYWDKRWIEGTTRWDQGHSHPTFIRVLKDRGDEFGIPRKGRAVVPSCGRGYDVHAFASRGLDVVGVDISSTAIEVAGKWISAQGQTPGSVDLVASDIFDYKPVDKFDVVLDYVHLCALPPQFRTVWAATLTSLSKPSPSSRLITIMFPLDEDTGDVGPPWALTEDTYHSLLDSQWEMIGSEAVKDGEKRHTGPPGRQLVAVWKRRA